MFEKAKTAASKIVSAAAEWFFATDTEDSQGDEYTVGKFTYHTPKPEPVYHEAYTRARVEPPINPFTGRSRWFDPNPNTSGWR